MAVLGVFYSGFEVTVYYMKPYSTKAVKKGLFVLSAIPQIFNLLKVLKWGFCLSESAARSPYLANARPAVCVAQLGVGTG